MSANQPPLAGHGQVIDAFSFKKTLENPAIARDFLLPLEKGARWEGERYTLGPGQQGACRASDYRRSFTRTRPE